MTRGIIYIVWGKYNRDALARSIRSAEKYGYDYQVFEVDDEGNGLAHKTQMYDLSPFDTTLFLDADTEIRGDLRYGFEQAERHGMALCIAPASNCYLASEPDIKKMMPYDLPQYNTGVIFWNNLLSVKRVFKGWKEIALKCPSSASNDQPSFSLAVYDEGFNPYVLPRTWNYRAAVRYEAKVIHGPVKILHAY